MLPLVVLAVETAMRRGELLGLNWEHISLTRRTAHLPMTKNGQARTVPLPTTAVATLEKLSPKATGNAVKLAFRRATARAGLEDLHFHDLRHEATTRLFERGLALMEVASITGHLDPRKLRRYTHLRAEDPAQKLGEGRNQYQLP